MPAYNNTLGGIFENKALLSWKEMFIFPKENVSFHEGNLLCADCKASAPTAKVIYKVHFKTSKNYRQ